MGSHSQHRADSVQAPRSYMSENEKEKDKDGASSSSSLLSLHEPFRNLDDPAVLAESMQALTAPTSRNFVLEFGDAHAHVAFDLDVNCIRELLGSERHEALSTRWINLWYPFQQRGVLETLAQNYDFSPRLLALMSADPRRRPRSPEWSSYAVAAEQDRMFDLESGSPTPSASRRSPDAVSLASTSQGMAGNLYDIVDEVWHYSSIDQGRSYLCLGYNSLYSMGINQSHSSATTSASASTNPRTKTSSRSRSQRIDSEQLNQPLPNVQRIWTWLVLLSDRTVLTITEDPFPYSSGYLSPIQQSILVRTRRNLTNVFRSLSKSDVDLRDKSPLTLLPIRRRLGETREETAHRSSDAPGLLFYYLFENWENSYSLVTRNESRYGLELQRVRSEMFRTPKLAHVDRLDQIGCQLMVLKRHYKAYLRLIERIVQPQSASPASLANSRVASKASVESLSSPGHAPAIFTFGARNQRAGAGNGDGVKGSEHMVTEKDSMLGVGMSTAAKVRFERLRDMIGLYALSECTDYLEQKESLVQMNFQLIAIKESIDVDRLTRAAYLMSKATVLFLPVSFMTSYFSAEFDGTRYTSKDYWIAFAVVFVASWLVLVGFGALSGTLESWKYLPGLKWVVHKIRTARDKKTMEDERVSMDLRNVST